MLTHSIGSFTFHGMRGAINYPTEIIAVETRPGRRGVTLWNVGEWGEAFDLETTLLTADYETARATFANYKTATAQNPMAITQGGVTVSGGLFQVLRVEPLRVEAIVRGHIGGSNAAYYGIVVARWSLFPIAN